MFYFNCGYLLNLKQYPDAIIPNAFMQCAIDFNHVSYKGERFSPKCVFLKLDWNPSGTQLKPITSVNEQAVYQQ